MIKFYNLIESLKGSFGFVELKRGHCEMILKEESSHENER